MSREEKRVLYVGKNIELVRTLLNSVINPDKTVSYQIEHKTDNNAVLALLERKKYHHLIIEESISPSLSNNIETLYPKLHCTFLNQSNETETSILTSASPSLISKDVQNVLNCISIPIYFRDKDDTIILCNQIFADKFGLTTDEIVGKKGNSFTPMTVHDDLKILNQAMSEDRQVHLYECELRDFKGNSYEVVIRKEFVESTDIQIGIVFDVSDLNEAKRGLEKEHIMLRATADISPDLIFFKDLESRFLGCNKQFEKFIGQSEKEILGKTDLDFFARDQALMCQQQDQDVMTHNEVFCSEEYLSYVDGERHFIDMRKVPLLDRNGKVYGLIGIGRDITAHQRLQKRLKVANAVFENSQDNIIVTDQTCNIISINKAACELFSYQKNELIDNSIKVLSSATEDSKRLSEICETLSGNGSWKGDISYVNKHQEIGFAWLDIYVVELEEGVSNFIFSFTDLAKNKANENKIKYLSKHDPLTGISNRIALFTKLEDAISRASFNHLQIAVMLININGFKAINDQYGHNEGDKALQEVAARLKNCVSEKDTLARFGGDEFVIIIDDLNNEHDAALTAQKIAEQFALPFNIADIEAQLSVNIGISLSPDDGMDVDTLLQNAERAMQRGNQDERDGYRFYTEHLTESSSSQLQLEAELKLALQEDQFELYYQPQFDLNKKLIIGMESLLRWKHPEHGLIFPDRFLSLAEETGLIIPLGLQWLEKVALQTQRWKRDNIHFGRIALALSVKQLEQISLISDIQTIIKNSGCSTRDIEFEVQEACFDVNNSTVQENLFNIRKLGIALTISGFGADIPVFHFIEPLGIDKFKIAEDYTQHVSGNVVAPAMIKSVLVLARELGVDVVGEVMDVVDPDCQNSADYNSVKAMRASEATFYLRCHKKK